MELLLIRHARPVRTEGATGPADPPLSPIGRRQAEALATWLTDPALGEAVNALYTSPLRRATETAAPLARAFERESTVEPALAEYDADASAYIPIEELRAAGDPRWMELPDDIVGFQNRVVEGIESLIADHPGERVALVCHGGVINMYVSAVLDTGPRMLFLPHYTSVSRVLASGGGLRTLDSLNETGHLRVAKVPLVEL
jgi:2,3-bisphosphoglycerate-dependent phosphoglycerate mutase